MFFRFKANIHRQIIDGNLKIAELNNEIAAQKSLSTCNLYVLLLFGIFDIEYMYVCINYKSVLMCVRLKFSSTKPQIFFGL